jgi:pimeloyl-ACP methyl ester carboxylesterase
MRSTGVSSRCSNLHDCGVNAPHWPGFEITIGGRAVFARSSASEGSALAPSVMVHGLGGQSTNWTDLMAVLDDEVDGWAIDLPGFGWSPPPVDADYSVVADAQVVCALLERIHSERGRPVHLLGNSMGGAVSVVAAAMRPDLVATLTLISPALPDLRPRRDTVGVPLVAVPGLGRRVFDRLARVPVERQVDGMVALNYADASAFTPTRRAEAIAEVRRRMQLPHAADALSGAARGLLRSFVDPGPHGLWSSASRIGCPTLVIYGGRDRLVDARRSRRAAQHLPHAAIVTLPRIGHVAQMEDPALVARFVRAMISERQARTV